MDGSLHIGRSISDALAQNELQRQRRVALCAVARDDVEAGNLQKLFLQRRGDVVGYRCRVRAGIGAGNLNNGIIDCRQIIHSELSIGREAGDDHRQRQQHSHHRSANKRSGQSRAFDLD